MITKQCEICGKVLEGYTEIQVSHMLDQHKLVHKYKKDKIVETVNHSKDDIVILDEEKEAKVNMKKKFME